MDTPATPQTFDQLGIIAPVAEVLRELGYETPTAIQSAGIPAILTGRDVLGQAQTGTGKTAAFALPLLSKLNVDLHAPQILVLTPTRELTIQVAEAFQSYARKLEGFHVLPIYGGQSMTTQLRQLKRGPQVVVGTPGRVMDHLRRKSLDLATLTSLVLDEADEMLNMGFVEDIEWILEHTPAEKQIALFSATMPTGIRKVAGKYLREPLEIKIQNKTSTVETISQYFWMVTGLHKLDALTRILEVEEFDAALIFVRTKTATVELAEKLEARGHTCAALNGDLSQELRERTVNALKRGDLDIIVATDIAARGLDVERIGHVINFDIPHDPEAYVHRIGRTGRAGRSGRAISFVAPRERRLLTAIERTTRQPMQQFPLPTKNEVAKKRIQRFKDQIQETLQSTDLSYFVPIVQQLAVEQETSELQIGAALCFLMQQSSPFVIEEASVEDTRRDERPRDNRPARDNRLPVGREERRRSEPRGERRERRSEPRDDSDKMKFRIEVGREHGATPSNIVGAIANSIGIEGRSIGHIDLYDEYSTVDLPRDLPREMLAYLQNVRVRDRKLHIRPYDLDPTQKERAFKPKSRPGTKPEKRQKKSNAAPKQWEKPKKFRKGAGKERH